MAAARIEGRVEELLVEEEHEAEGPHAHPGDDPEIGASDGAERSRLEVAGEAPHPADEGDPDGEAGRRDDGDRGIRRLGSHESRVATRDH